MSSMSCWGPPVQIGVCALPSESYCEIYPELPEVIPDSEPECSEGDGVLVLLVYMSGRCVSRRLPLVLARKEEESLSE